MLLLLCLPPAEAGWDRAIVAREHGDFATAYREIRPEAMAGAADAQAVLGEMLMHGQGTPRDEQAGLTWLHRSAEGGSVTGMLDYGSGLISSGKAADGLRWVTRAAEGGAPAAMVILGRRYEKGSGMPRNIVAAHDWYLKAAQAGDREGMFRLAELLLSPDEGASDDRTGVQWLKQAAEAGMPKAQTRLALIYADGSHGITPDPAEATRWAEKAELRDRDAGGLLCRLYATGIPGWLNDDTAAFRWCRLAAESGVPAAMVRVARLYLDGRGVGRDPSAALMWALAAQTRPEPVPADQAKQIAAAASSVLSEAEQTAARAKARAWRPLP